MKATFRSSVSACSRSSWVLLESRDRAELVRGLRQELAGLLELAAVLVIARLFLRRGRLQDYDLLGASCALPRPASAIAVSRSWIRPE
jgi:hypothetical protein